MDRQKQLTSDLLHIHALSQRQELDDRTLAIVSCAYLEDVLQEAIAARLPAATETLRKKIFAPTSGFAGAMGAKIDFAEAIDAIGPHAAVDLRTMAKIRNKFAHSVQVASFDADQVRGLVENLGRLDEVGAEPLAPLKGGSRFHYPGWTDTSLRGRFAYSALGYTVSLYNASVDAGFGLLRAD